MFYLLSLQKKRKEKKEKEFTIIIIIIITITKVTIAIKNIQSESHSALAKLFVIKNHSLQSVGNINNFSKHYFD